MQHELQTQFFSKKWNLLLIVMKTTLYYILNNYISSILLRLKKNAYVVEKLVCFNSSLWAGSVSKKCSGVNISDFPFEKP